LFQDQGLCTDAAADHDLASFLAAIDEWRRHQPDLPPRAEAIRRLADQALKASDPRARKR
jgi:hypothetical protein